MSLIEDVKCQTCKNLNNFINCYIKFFVKFPNLLCKTLLQKEGKEISQISRLVYWFPVIIE